MLKVLVYEGLWGFCCVSDTYFTLVYRTGSEAPLGQFQYRFLFLPNLFLVCVCVVWVYVYVILTHPPFLFDFVLRVEQFEPQ